MTPLIASASPGLPRMPGQTAAKSRNFGEVFLILGCILAITLLVVIWAAFIRKPKRPDAVGKILEVADESSSKRSSSVGSSGRRKKKIRRREHRPRNPTLAETGGLPPPKSDDVESP